MRNIYLTLSGLFVLLVSGGPAEACMCSMGPLFDNFSIWNVIQYELARLSNTTTTYMVEGMEAIRNGQSITPVFWAIGLGFAYGVLHALGPGHGKMVVTGYFLGRDASIRNGIVMGAQVAAIHVFSAILIVGLADLILSAVLDTQSEAFRYVRLGSYGAIAGIGLYLLYRSVLVFLARKGWVNSELAMPEHNCSSGCSHNHQHNHQKMGLAARSQGFVSMVVGAVPCTGAMLVMLFALSQNMVVLGIAVTVAISVGMAMTISFLGIGAILIRRASLEKSQISGQDAVVRTGALDLFGALLITAVGMTLFTATLNL